MFLLLNINMTESFRTHDNILEKIRTCDIFHFARHGEFDFLNFSMNCLFLNNWNVNLLTVKDLRNSKLQDFLFFIEYLSACLTNVNHDENLNNKNIHFVNAFQLTEFCYVVETLWKIFDNACVNVTKIFYDTIRKKNMIDDSINPDLHYAV